MANCSIQLWLADPNTWTDVDELQAGFELFRGSSEEARLSEIKLPHRRHEFLVAHRLLADALVAHEVDPSHIRRDELGKPRLESGEAPSLHFNWSYSEKLIVCGVSACGPLGVDVESLDRQIELDPVVKRYFAPEEQQVMRRLKGEQALEAFFSVWTLKEAFLKGIGTGLRTSVLKCAFRVTGGEILFNLAEGVPHDAERWSFALVGEGRHRIGVACNCVKSTGIDYSVVRSSPTGWAAPEELSPLARRR